MKSKNTMAKAIIALVKNSLSKLLMLKIKNTIPVNTKIILIKKILLSTLSYFKDFTFSKAIFFITFVNFM